MAKIYNEATRVARTVAALSLHAGDSPRRRTRRPTTGGVGPLGLGVATLWLSIVVLLPLSAVLVKSLSGGAGALWEAISAPGARAALVLTLGISAVVTPINVVTGTLIAWVLVRDEFRGKAS